jgi:hypothetical protein
VLPSNFSKNLKLAVFVFEIKKMNQKAACGVGCGQYQASKLIKLVPKSPIIFIRFLKNLYDF